MDYLTLLTHSQQAQLRAVCTHEAGHYICAECYGLNPQVKFSWPDNGVCLFSECSPRQDAVVSLGGVLAEDLMDAPVGRVFPVRISANTIYPWADNIGRYNLTLSDLRGLRRGIEGGFSQYDATRECHKILSQNLGALNDLTNDFVAQSAEIFFHNHTRSPREAAAEMKRLLAEHNEVTHH
jgi:hypothetical protein